MNQELLLVLGLLLMAIAMFVANKPRMDVVALLMIAALPFTGVISISEALTGFSDPNIILIALLFVLGEGLVRTGVARSIGDWINNRSKGSETRLMVLLMASVGILGASMSSTAVVAIFIPVVLRICQNTGMAPSKLMMPLSFAALISGMLSLISTAPNLVINSEMERQGLKAFGFFDITPFGLAVLVLGIIYMLYARKFLPEGEKGLLGKHRKPTFDDFVRIYELDGREYRMRVLPGSKLLGAKLLEMNLREQGITLLAIERKVGKKIIMERPTEKSELKLGDVLLLDVRMEAAQVHQMADELGAEIIQLSSTRGYLTDFTQEIGMTEAIIPAESTLIGKTVREARMRDRAGLTVVGLRSGQETITDGLLDATLQLGDTILLSGFWKDLQQNYHDKKDLVFLHLPAEFDEVLPASGKAPQAVLVLALTVLGMVTGILPNVHVVLIGCLLMGLLGCVDMPSAYASINWKSLVLIVGMLPFSLALQRTGGIDLAAEALLGAVGEASPYFALTAVFLITAALGLFISNTATAVLMAPVAIALAKSLAVSPYPFAMIVALAASTAFMTPVSSPVNTLVVVPGSYKFSDFMRIGLPFSMVVMIVSVLLVPLLLPF